METQENKPIEVPMGDSKDDIKAREGIISDVYRSWYASNPSRAVYNAHLKDCIHKGKTICGVISVKCH